MTTLLQVKIELTARTEVYEGMRISSTSQARLNVSVVGEGSEF